MTDLTQFKELTESQLKRWTYPGGEVGVRVPSGLPEHVLWRIQNSDDLVALIMACGVDSKEYWRSKKLFIPYMPYARQDRAAVDGDPNAIRMLARMIGTAGVRDVVTLDAHSDKTQTAFGDCGVSFIDLDPSPYILQFLDRLGRQGGRELERFVFISPDKGAEEKTRKYATAQGVNQTIICAKERDPETGKLKGFYVKEVENEIPTIAPHQTFVIVDDICDGGRTFFGVKQAAITRFPHLKDSTFALWTSHGIYSQGLDVLAKEFKFIGSTNSFLHGLVHPALVTIPLI